MRITERRLRRIIRSVITEQYGELPSGLETPENHQVEEPLYAKNQETGESEADRVLRVAEELRAKGKGGLANKLRKLAKEIQGIFEPYTPVN